MIQGLLGPIASLAGTWLNGKVEEKAAQKLLPNGNNTPMTLCAVGAGLFALVMVLRVHIRRGLRPATVSAGMEMQSQAQVSMAPNIFYSGGDEAKLGAGGMAESETDAQTVEWRVALK